MRGILEELSNSLAFWFAQALISLALYVTVYVWQILRDMAYESH
ncbi:MAG: hypothetical protein V2A58_17795 [Planctomycetota bacterium]